MTDIRFESTLVPPAQTTSVRRVVIELPEDRALDLARVIDDKIVWSTTNVEYELDALHTALRGN